MTAVQIAYEELVYWLDPPALRAESLEGLSEGEVERLLVQRYRAFTRRGLDWRQALLMAVKPDRSA